MSQNWPLKGWFWFQICDAKVAVLRIFFVNNFLWEKHFDIPLVWGGSWNLWLQDIDPWRGAIRILQDARAEANLSLNLGCYMKYSQSREHNMIQDWNHPCCWSLRFILFQWHEPMGPFFENRDGLGPLVWGHPAQHCGLWSHVTQMSLFTYLWCFEVCETFLTEIRWVQLEGYCNCDVMFF